MVDPYVQANTITAKEDYIGRQADEAQPVGGIEMVDRVMAAMKEASYVEGLTFEQERRHIARAAIEAMRNPTEAMVVAGCRHENMGDMAGRFNAMIDAALAE